MTPERWRQITDVFHAALAHPAAERAPFLAEACRDDAALREEVESMLAVHVGAGEARQVPTLVHENALEELDSGHTIGPYTIDGLIGAGGMGRVYRGRDPRIGRDVAIKVLPADCAFDPRPTAGFEQEARASGALTHPNVLTATVEFFR